MVVQLPHECFVEEMRENPHAAEGPLDPEWTEQYRQHPVVLRNQVATVMPYVFVIWMAYLLQTRTHCWACLSTACTGISVVSFADPTFAVVAARVGASCTPCLQP
jgi:hypothetical protein